MMNNYPICQARNMIQSFGRTYFDEREQVLYANYTCAGFEIEYTGAFLGASFRAVPDTMLPQGSPSNTDREDWPRIAVLLDDNPEPVRTQAVRDGEQVALWFSREPERHRIRIVKLTENFRTALGLQQIFTDGTIMPCAREEKQIIEFVGDSITCGFGNETSEVNHDFRALEENGWMTCGAQAARRLGFEARFICVSGISVQADPNMPGMYGMEQLYPYADRIIQDRLALCREETVEEYLPFDFQSHPAQYVVLNLGTNDANQICFASDCEQAEKQFGVHYRQLVESIRMLNGPKTVIICALGCMSYYLFDIIQRVVDGYAADTGDRNITLLKYGKMMNSGPDAGGCLHPTIYRHSRMAEELVRKIRTLEGSEMKCQSGSHPGSLSL